MNITYVIGNGFDLNLGLKTSYEDFYKYYERTFSPNDDVCKIKASIKKDQKNWSDLEFALGQYTKKVSEQKTMRSIYEDLVNSLNRYLDENSDLIPPSNEKIKSSFLNDIIFPENSLERMDKENIQLNFYNSFSSAQPTHVNFITFNYTLTIEKLLGFNKSIPIKIPTLCFNNSNITTVENIYHLHHILNNTIVVGVNDESQIANEVFRKDIALRELLIKPQTNRMLKSGVDGDCKSIIQNTDLFVLFGVSMGATDKMWWQLIVERLKVNARIILFEYDKKFKNSRELGIKERSVKNRFLSYSDLSDDEKKIITNHIYVPVNKNIFSKTRSFFFFHKR